MTKDDPPTKLIHGDADTLVPIGNSESMKAALEEADVTHDFHVIKGGGHGFRDPAHRVEADQEMVAWFKEHLASKSVADD